MSQNHAQPGHAPEPEMRSALACQNIQVRLEFSTPKWMRCGKVQGQSSESKIMKHAQIIVRATSADEARRQILADLEVDEGAYL